MEPFRGQLSPKVITIFKNRLLIEVRRTWRGERDREREWQKQMAREREGQMEREWNRERVRGGVAEGGSVKGMDRVKGRQRRSNVG